MVQLRYWRDEVDGRDAQHDEERHNGRRASSEFFFIHFNLFIIMFYCVVFSPKIKSSNSQQPGDAARCHNAHEFLHSTKDSGGKAQRWNPLYSRLKEISIVHCWVLFSLRLLCIRAAYAGLTFYSCNKFSLAIFFLLYALHRGVFLSMCCSWDAR